MEFHPIRPHVLVPHSTEFTLSHERKPNCFHRPILELFRVSRLVDSVNDSVICLFVQSELIAQMMFSANYRLWGEINPTPICSNLVYIGCWCGEVKESVCGNVYGTSLQNQRKSLNFYIFFRYCNCVWENKGEGKTVYSCCSVDENRN